MKPLVMVILAGGITIGFYIMIWRECRTRIEKCHLGLITITIVFVLTGNFAFPFLNSIFPQTKIKQEDNIIVSPAWQRQMVENDKLGKTEENRQAFVDLLNKEGVKIADDEHCVLDMKIWKITIGKLQQSRSAGKEE